MTARRKRGDTKDDSVVSAQVILRASSGRRWDPRAVITSETIGDWTPAPESAAAARRYFSREGFRVGPLVGTSFSITATLDRFASVFGVPVEYLDDGSVAVKEGRTPSRIVPLRGVPRDIADRLEAVTFGEPPDFGPDEFTGP